MSRDLRIKATSYGQINKKENIPSVNEGEKYRSTIKFDTSTRNTKEQELSEHAGMISDQ